MRHPSRLLAMLLTVILILPTMMFPSIAAGGSYSINWAAADPAPNNGSYAPTYPKWEPSDVDYPVVGRENDPLPDAVAFGPTNASSDFDAVESLMPKSLALGQIVPFEVVISVTGSTAPENGTIIIEPYWLTKTTNGGDFGFDPAYGVIGAFVDYGDVGTSDPGGNATVSSLDWGVINVGTSNEQIVGDVTITGLDDGDIVVVELWVVLKETVSESENGNVQTGMGDAYTSDSAIDVINTGKQTVPLLKAGTFFTEDADLTIIKSDSPDPVIIGENLSYSITVTNNSPETVANGILVTDTLDANVTFVSASDSGMHNVGIITWPEFSLVPGESKVLTINVTVDPDAPVLNFLGTSADGRGGTTPPTAGSFDLLNKVEVSAITDDPDVSNNVYFEPTNVKIQEMPSLNITKTATESSFSQVGDVINYTIAVENTGNVNLTNVLVTDALLGTLTGPAADIGVQNVLDVGETWTFTGSYTVDQDDIDFGRVDNIAYADSDQTDRDSDDESVPSTQGPALNITKTATEENFVAVGDIIHYTIEVENIGNVTLTGIVVSDPLLGTLNGPTGDGGQAGKLDVDETWTYTGSYTVDQDDLDLGKVDNTATADSDQTGPDTDSETVPAVKSPALNITKVAAEMSFNSVGNVIHYTITVENTGNVTLTGVTVTDPLLGILTGPTGDGGQPGKLDVDEIWTFTGTHTITQADLDLGRVDNTATADSDQTGPDTDSETVPAVQNPSLTIDKTVAENSFGKVGDALHYTITVENIGNITLTGVDVVDATIGTLSGPTSNMDTDNLLEVGEIWTYTGTYTVDQDDIDFGRVDNTAYADSNETDRVSDDETVPSTQGPALNITKTAAESSYDAVGDVIHYTITVENLGNVTLTGVVVSDPLVGTLAGPTVDTGQQGKLDVGETWTFTGTYTITQADLDSGKVDNTATADSDQTSPDTDSETVPAVQNPSLNILKDADETSFDAVDDVIHYTITVDNTGNITLTGITVSDPLLGTLSGPTGDADADGKLDVNETWTYTGSYTIKLADLNRGYVLNTAYADSDQTETDQDDETVPAEINRGLTIDKKTNGLDSAGRILVGRTVTWTYRVTNTSNITLTNIVVRDNKFSEPIGTITSLAPGASETLSKSGTATLGDYTNEGTATFTPVEGAPIVARDTSSYTGYRERRDDPDPDPDYGDIRIFKFLDSDNDGEFDENSLTELPMNGMEFALYDEDKTFIESLETGLNGTLTFRNLDFGTYYLKEMNPGFTITSDNFGADGFSDPIRVNSTTTVVVEVGNRRNVATPEPIVDEVVDVIEEVPEAETPLALPDTGEIPPFFAYGFGSLLMLAGAYMKRRSR